jgi:hypothetical protein
VVPDYRVALRRWRNLAQFPCLRLDALAEERGATLPSISSGKSAVESPCTRRLRLKRSRIAATRSRIDGELPRAAAKLEHDHAANETNTMS